MSFVDKPQLLWWRKALFQVHLWVGIFAAIYIVLIGVSGSILVFKDELAELSYPHLLRNRNPGQPENFDLAQVMMRAQAAYPKLTLGGGYVPGVGSENVLVFLTQGPTTEPRYYYAFADPATGQLLGLLDVNATWLYWISDLHVRLLAGIPGAVANAAGGLLLLVLALSGIVLWWPGIRRWASGLKIDFRRNWKRINFDVHNAVGFYTLLWVCMWSISGINFIFPKQVAAVVGWFSSPAAAVEPELKPIRYSPKQKPAIAKMLASARAALPGTRLSGIYLGEPGTGPARVFMARGDRDDFTQMDYAFCDPVQGNVISLWHSGVNPTAGSKFLFWLGPLHFGVAWGLGGKILWALLGLSLPLLAVTGALMYWNRSFRRSWKRWRQRRKNVPSPASEELSSSV